jgi:transglutaminase-like putative cysteine protease
MSERFKLDEGWLSLFLLYVMLITTALSISATRWTSGLGHLTTTAALGLFFGLLLAKSHFPAVIAHMFSLIYGLFLVGYLIGRMVPQPTWADRIVELNARLSVWLNKAFSGGTSRDSLIFVLLLAALFWLLGYIASWYTFRRPRLWRVLLPIGLTMLVNYYVYTDPRIATRSNASLTPYLMIFLMAAILYLVRTHLYLRELEWQSARVNYSTELRLDFVRAGAIVALVALTATLLSPGARAAPQLNTLWGSVEDMRSGVRDTASRLFASLDTYGRGVANPFSNRAVLGGPRNLGEEVLFDVKAPDGRYWRAAVYDHYTGDSWLNRASSEVVVPPNQSMAPRDTKMRREVTQTLTVYLVNSTQLFAAPEPARVPNLSVRADVAIEQNRVNSAVILHSQQSLPPGTIYQVVSSVSYANPDSLREAETEYSQWIQDRYLQLPGTITDRTRALAAEITAGHESAFDKAQAIEGYLRQNLSYDLEVPAPPEDQDFVDFVLFDLQSGYCDYYASSFVVLARAAGVPARMGYGYAQDNYEEEANAYRVRAKNGHSWPEVYFPEYGWIQFEPTVIIDPIEWPAAPVDGAQEELSDAQEDNLFDRPELPDMPMDEMLDPGFGSVSPFQQPSFLDRVLSILPMLGLALLAGGLILGTFFWISEVRGTRELNLIERAYARMWRFASWLGIPSPPDQTPYERAEALAIVVPEGKSSITRIADMYVVERFGQGNGNDDSEATQQWTALRPKLWKAWLMERLHRLQNRDQTERRRDFRDALLRRRGRES